MNKGKKQVIKVPEEERFIDIKKVIKSKNAKLARLLPWFVVSYLRRILHEDEMNSFLYLHKEIHGLDFIDAVFNEFEATIEVINEENIPKSGRFVMCSNHPLGGLDGITFIHAIGKIRKDIAFPVNDILLNLPNLRELFIPINKHGKNVQNIDIINETFESGKMILYFPAGLVSRKTKGKIADLEWKPTFVSKARKFKRDIIPVYMDASNSKFFYNLASFRKKIGLKANIEMLYLVNEMYKQRNKKFTLVIGEPVSIDTVDKSMNNKKWADFFRSKAYDLKKQIK